MKKKNLLFVSLMSLTVIAGCNKNLDEEQIVENIKINMIESYKKMDDAFKLDIVQTNEDEKIGGSIIFNRSDKVCYNYLYDNDEEYEYYVFMEGINYVETYPKSKAYKVIDDDHSSYLYWSEVGLEIDATMILLQNYQSSILSRVSACLNGTIDGWYGKNADIKYDFKFYNNSSIKGEINVDYNSSSSYFIEFNIKDNILRSYTNNYFDKDGNIYNGLDIKFDKDSLRKPKYKGYTLDEYNVITGEKADSKFNADYYGLFTGSSYLPHKYEIHRKVQGNDNVYKYHYDEKMGTLYYYENSLDNKEEAYYILDGDILHIYDVNTKKHRTENYALGYYSAYEYKLRTAKMVYENNRNNISNKITDKMIKESSCYINKPGDFTISYDNNIEIMLKMNGGLPTYRYYKGDDVEISIKNEWNTTLYIPSFEGYSEF